jgi:1,2-phenylacetyl-CoA epoxidase PaaB subunit
VTCTKHAIINTKGCNRVQADLNFEIRRNEMKEKQFASLLESTGYVSRDEFEQFDTDQAKRYIDTKEGMICDNCSLIGGPLCDSRNCGGLRENLRAHESTIPSTVQMRETPGSDKYENYSVFLRQADKFKFQFRSGSDTAIHEQQRDCRNVLAIALNTLTPREKTLAIMAVSTILPIETAKENMAAVYKVSVRRIEQEFESIQDKIRKAAKEKKYQSFKFEEMKIKE